MLEQILLLAQNSARYNRGLLFFKGGLTLTGIAIIGMGFSLAFSKPKDNEPPTSPIAKWLALGICGAAGLGIIGYAWLVFES